MENDKWKITVLLKLQFGGTVHHTRDNGFDFTD
jgi:hypothetical protein